MQRTLLFLVNPKAGKAEIKNNLLDIIDQFVRHDWKVVVRTTQRAGEVTDIIREEACQYDMIVCAGGDGTLNEAVCGLQQTSCRPKLGYIPAGTTNDFAVSLGIPRDAQYAATTITDGIPFSCDVGQFNGQHFVYVAAFGLFTEVSYSTPQQYKNALGRAAYILEGIKSLAEIKTHTLTIEHNGESITGEFIFGMVSNSTSVGGFKMGDPKKVSMNDGLLEVTLVKKPRSILELQETIASLLQNDLTGPCLYTFHASEVRAHSDAEVPWTLDGEFGGSLCDVEICVKPQAYEIMVPPPAQKRRRAGDEAEESMKTLPPDQTALHC